MIINPRHATALSRSSSLALRTPRKSRNSRHSPNSVALPLSLQWAHYGMLHQITAWPDVRVEKNYGGEWIPVRPSAELLEAAALELSRRGHSAHWDSYLDFVPLPEREFIQHFEFNRVSALLAVAHCPMLLPDLRRTPALIVFLAEQFELRSEGEATWGQLNAVYERAGIWGVLEWLGLPATTHTLRALGDLDSPDLPHRFLKPLRAQLWAEEPQALSFSERLVGRSLRHTRASTYWSVAQAKVA